MPLLTLNSLIYNCCCSYYYYYYLWFHLMGLSYKLDQRRVKLLSASMKRFIVI